MAEELGGGRGRRNSVAGVSRADDIALRMARRPEGNPDTHL